MRLKPASSILSLLLLAGCAVTSIEPEPIWGFSGKMSVRTESISRVLSIDWTERAETSLIALSGPLGVPIAEVTADQNGIRLLADGQDNRFTNELPILLADGSQLRFPWPDIRSWVRGRSIEGQTIDGTGVLQGEWFVRVTENGRFGPQKIVIEHDSGQLTLRVQNWRMAGQ